MNKTYRYLAVAFIILLLAGCQPTPEQSVVIGKGDGQLEEKISSQSDAGLPSDIPESGTRITGTYTHGSLPITIKVDALVNTQDGKTMPAAKVTPHQFTQAEVDAVYDCFVGDAHFFRIPEGQKWDALEAINVRTCELQLAAAEASGDYTQEQLNRMQGNLSDARREYLAAQPASAFPAVGHTLSAENLTVSGGAVTGAVFGYFERDGMAYRLEVFNEASGLDSTMALQRYSIYDLDESCGELPGAADAEYLEEGESLSELSYEDALAEARQAASAFEARGMAVAHAEAVQYPKDTLTSYYTFIFTHEVKGVPCLYNTTGIANDEGYSDVWGYEQLIVKVDAYGLRSVRWIAPCDVTEQLADSTAMIAFADVMDCFSKMVFIKNSYLEGLLDASLAIAEDGAPYDNDAGGPVAPADGDRYEVDSVVVHVNRIDLGLMRVQSGNEYLLIPVWDFYGCEELLTADGQDIHKLSWEQSNTGEYVPAETCLLTVNAIDGSIIDREQGY